LANAGVGLEKNALLVEIGSEFSELQPRMIFDLIYRGYDGRMREKVLNVVLEVVRDANGAAFPFNLTLRKGIRRPKDLKSIIITFLRDLN
jgi:hypothetical protein